MSPSSVLRNCLFSLIAILATFKQATAQSSYRQTDLVSNVFSLAANYDHALANPWGLAFGPGQPFRVANHANGLFTAYDATGASQPPFLAAVAGPAPQSTPSKPTGVVFNSTGLFQLRQSPLPSPFLYSTEDGTISGEYADANGNILQTTILAVDQSQQGAVYTGLAILTPNCCAPFLAAADFHRGFVDTYTSFFAPLGPAGNFQDPNLPAGYAPYNLQVLGSQLFIAYALQDSAKHSAVPGAGNGIVDIFDLEGNFVRRFVSNGPLNAPWGIARASANFGQFSNDILIGNSGNGLINAFDPVSGNYLGFLTDRNGDAIVDLGLRGMVFGAGGDTDPNTLYLTADLIGGPLGVLGAITVDATAAAAADFSVQVASPTATVPAGQSATFALTAAAMGSFTGNISFSCIAPAGVTCTFNPPVVAAGASADSTTLTVSTPANMAQNSVLPGLIAPGLALAGLGIFGFGRLRRDKLHNWLRGPSTACTAVALLCLLGASLGCSAKYATPGNTPALTPTGPIAVAIKAQSGTLSHTIIVSITVQ